MKDRAFKIHNETHWNVVNNILSDYGYKKLSGYPSYAQSYLAKNNFYIQTYKNSNSLCHGGRTHDRSCITSLEEFIEEQVNPLISNKLIYFTDRYGYQNKAILAQASQNYLLCYDNQHWNWWDNCHIDMPIKEIRQKDVEKAYDITITKLEDINEIMANQ